MMNDAWFDPNAYAWIPGTMLGLYGALLGTLMGVLGSRGKAKGFVHGLFTAGLVGCGALHILWEDLAEVKSLAVREDQQGRGTGASIVRACIDEAREIGLQTVFALTYRPGFFERLGFVQADVMTLPRKVWGECYRCPKFPGCNEIALTYTIDGAAAPARQEP